jgi:hypothetical protein
MTAKEFLTKFPDATGNDNCLKDLACPKCGHRESFLIDIEARAVVRDDGTEVGSADHDWQDTSYCACGNDACPLEGEVSDFAVYGLDKLILSKGDPQ